MARQQFKRTGRVNTTLELHFDNIMTLLTDAVNNGDASRFGLSEATRLEQLAKQIRMLVNERDGRESVWIGGKIVGIQIPSFPSTEEQMAWEHTFEEVLSSVKGFQSFELASGARPCYFIEFDEDTPDQELIGEVEKAIAESLLAHAEERAQETESV